MEKEGLLKVAEALRKTFLYFFPIWGIASVLTFFFSKEILVLLLRVVEIKVYYFTLPEVFFSMLELSFFGGLFFCMPIFLIILWINLRRIYRINLFLMLLAISLFYAGSLFCYLVVLKSGVSFLLGFGGEKIKAMISVERFIIFAVTMIFAFGITFETPLFLFTLRRFNVVNSRMLEKKRRYAVLLITIFAAVITPTPDVYNMMLLAVPTYILYELGIIMVKIDELRKGKVESHRKGNKTHKEKD